MTPAPLVLTMLLQAAQQAAPPTVATVVEGVTIGKLILWAGLGSLASTVGTLITVWAIVRPHFDRAVMEAQKRSAAALKDWMLNSLFKEEIMARDVQIAGLQSLVQPLALVPGKLDTAVSQVMGSVEKLAKLVGEHHSTVTARLDGQDKVLTDTRIMVGRVDERTRKNGSG